MADKEDKKRRKRSSSSSSSSSSDSHRKSRSRSRSPSRTKKSRKHSVKTSRSRTRSVSTSSHSEHEHKSRRKRRARSSISASSSSGERKSKHRKRVRKSATRRKSRSHSRSKMSSASRSSSSSSSSSASRDSEYERKRVKKSKHHKTTKKKKKRKKTKKKGKRASYAVDQHKYGKYGILSEADQFTKQPEFYCWLQEARQVNPETLPRMETKKYFETFMEDYNTATLPHKKYYNLAKWEMKQNARKRLKEIKKAKKNSISFADDESKHTMKFKGEEKRYGLSKERILEMKRAIQERTEQEYKKNVGFEQAPRK